MRLLVINPTETTLKYLRDLRVRYEVVESAALLDSAFQEPKGFFDGVIAPNDPEPGVVRTIGSNWFVDKRELPIFVYGKRLTTKKQMAHVVQKLLHLCTVSLCYTDLKTGFLKSSRTKRPE